MTAADIGAAAMIFALGVLFTQACLAVRRQLVFRRVRKTTLASQHMYGLFLERPRTPFDAGSRNTNGKTAEHVCSFPQPCGHAQRETARRAAHLRVMEGGGA